MNAQAAKEAARARGSRVALALGGGAARGLAHIGAALSMLEADAQAAYPVRSFPSARSP